MGVLVLSLSVMAAASMGTAFTYQGRLTDANLVADGQYDFKFQLYDMATDGNQIAGDVTIGEVEVVDGYFTAQPDFGSSAFTGDARWLAIGIRPGVLEDPNDYNDLTPRQEVTPTPYAIYAGAVAGGITGSGTSNRIARFTSASTIGDSQVYQNGQGNIGIGGTPYWGGAMPGYGPDLHIKAGTDMPIVWIGDSNQTNGADIGDLSFIGNASGGFGKTTYSSIRGKIINGSAFDGKGALTFHTLSPFVFPSGGGLEEQMRIDPKGRVGIGTQSPTGLLHVSKDGSSDELVVDYDTGKVGIGLEDPDHALDVNRSTPAGMTAIRVRNLDFDPDSSAALVLGMGTSDFSKIYCDQTNATTIENLRQNADIHMRVTVAGTPTTKITLEGNSGDVGINREEPEQDLDIDGIVRIRQWTISGIGSTVQATSSGDLFKTISSKRFKTNIEPLENSDAVFDLEPVSFDWKKSGVSDVGLIAEDVAEKIEKLTVFDKDGRPESVRYELLSVYLLDAVKQLKAENENLKKRLEKLEETTYYNNKLNDMEVLQ